MPCNVLCMSVCLSVCMAESKHSNTHLHGNNLLIERNQERTKEMERGIPNGILDLEFVYIELAIWIKLSSTRIIVIVIMMQI